MAFTAKTPTSAYSWRPDITVFHADDVIPEALILQCSNVAGAVEGDAPSVRVAYVDDDEATFVAESATIPEAEPDLAECVVFTGKISQLIRVSREQYNQDGTADQLAKSVARALVKKADVAFLNHPAPVLPATNPAAGLLNITGIVAGGAVGGSLDVLVDLVAQLQANGGTPSHIVVDPIGWGELRKLKYGTGSNQSLLGAGTSDAEPMLLSLPVLVNVGMPSLSGVVVDKMAAVSAVGPVMVATSADAYFSTDDIGLRATWRIGQNIVRPDRVGSFTITPAA
ncbi:phage major capsid protein [Mycolicibacterium sp. XJ870]